MKIHKITLFLLVFVFVIVGFATASDYAFAAPQISNTSATVNSNDTVRVSGSLDAAIFQCNTSDGNRDSEPVCFCCDFPTKDFNFDGFNTCDINDTFYRIRNTDTSTWTVWQQSFTPSLSPTSCTNQCSTSACSQDGTYSFTTQTLAPGNYFVRVIAADECGTQSSVDRYFTIEEDVSLPTASCSASPNPAEVNGTVTWTGSGSGGTGSGYQYRFETTSGTILQNWSTDRTYTNSYSTTGAKQLNVRVKDSANNWSASPATCSVQVNPIQDPVLCSSSQSQVIKDSAASKNSSRTFYAQGGVAPYAWSSSLGISPSSGSGSSFTGSLNSGKFSTVQVTDSTGAQNRCGIDVIDIQANNSDGPITITVGDSVNLKWNFGLRTSSHSYTCSASGAWSGSKAPNGGSNTTYAAQTVTPSTSGTKTYTITCTNNTNGTGPVSDSVTVNVNPPAVTTGTINVTSKYSNGVNAPTTWSLSGPEPRTQSTQVSSMTYSDMDGGTYTISPGAKSGYSVSVSPSSSQTLPGGGVITFNIVYTPIPVSNYTLSVQKQGTGSGTVTASGINCGSDCSQAYSSGTSVNLYPTASAGSTFAGWSGCDSVSGTTCTVTMNTNRTVTATFSLSNTNDAVCVGISAPGTVSAGADFSATITMRNTGSTAWDGTYRLGSQNPGGDNNIWGTHRVYISSPPVNPGEQEAFTRTFTAPSSPGTYDFDWRMVEELVEWFGETCNSTNIVVTAPGTINVSSNIDTTWTITGPQGYSGSGTSASYTNAPAGTYTITYEEKDGWTWTLTSQANQTLSGGGTINFGIEYTEDGSSNPECSDGIDNDGDGDVDYPNDLGCSSADDEDESGDPLLPDNDDPNFFLTNSGNIQINTLDGKGTSNTSTIKVTALNGFNSNVGLSVQSDEIPGTAGSDYTFNFNPDTLPEGQYSSGSEFSVTLTSATPSGTYPIVIEGTGGDLSGRTTQVNLLVNSSDPRFEEF